MENERIWNASMKDLAKGYTENEETYECIACGRQFEKGLIYPVEELLYEAEKFVVLHIAKEHGSAFDYLIQQDKQITGLSEIQSKLLGLFYEGKSDKEAQEEMGMGSTSTIRNHRFVLKEKERQARVFLTLMELLRAQEKGTDSGRLGAARARTLEGRHRSTATEQEKVLAKYFPQGVQGPLKNFSMKEKQKLVVLHELAKRFEQGKQYTEKEVNELLGQAFEDYAILRRYLIDYGFMARQEDGSAYWLTELAEGQEEKSLNRRDELKLQAKEIKIEAGVFQIRNLENGKVFIDSKPNLKSMNGHEFSLDMGSFINKNLQADWKKYGKDAFVFEVLEVLKPKDGEAKIYDPKDALKKLEEKWLEAKQPYGDQGYNE
ncbi:hypothetical protein J2Z69_002577 [Paenibacillus shirakamiensis]|uniref:DUF2087 domain-containing protein n=1 Tax=Paenibacillus shirakamiensis TaxID=1265935 RepID=A0ABS4JIL2_9BACL|nr:DUF2087 domain-containing protein [Paenibacillus shirakamiensis]MBP2001532.1 hypothetical protein [Paenibacillus shirakamiensis]